MIKSSSNYFYNIANSPNIRLIAKVLKTKIKLPYGFRLNIKVVNGKTIRPTNFQS